MLSLFIVESSVKKKEKSHTDSRNISRFSSVHTSYLLFLSTLHFSRHLYVGKPGRAFSAELALSILLQDGVGMSI